MTIAAPVRQSNVFRRRVTLALAVLAAVAVIQGAFALWAVGLAERHVLRGRVAADIKQGFTELRSDKQQLRNWLAQRQFGADAKDSQRDALLERMRGILDQLNDLAAQAISLDDNPAARQRQAQRRDALLVLGSSLAQLGRGLASLNPPPIGADTTVAWLVANELFDRAEGRDLRGLLQESMEREEISLMEKRSDTNKTLNWLRRLWIGSTAALVVGALLLAAGFAQALRRPLLSLTEGAAALRSGRLSHRIALDGRDEFADVARGMNAMAEELAEHRKREAEARQALEEQVASRTAELRAALKTQQEAEARRRQLFADISHELRTPTTAIRGEAQVTLRGGSKSVGEYVSSLRRIEDAARQLGLTIDDLLTMARGDIDALSLRRVPIDFTDVLDAVMSHGEAMARAAQVTLSHAPSPDGLAMSGDADRLRQLLLALLDNAVRYSHPGGSVKIHARRIERDGPRVEVDIQDHGIGIDTDDLMKIFARSHRGQNAIKHRADGSGLGLPIARVLARGHGGEITLKSSTLSGTTATVSLPLAMTEVRSLP